MRNISKILALVAVIAAIAIIATILHLEKGGGNYSNIAPTNDERAVQSPQMADANSPSSIRHIIHSRQADRNPTTSGLTNQNPIPARATPGLITDWEEKVDGIISAEGDEKEKAKKLIDIFPNLPPDGQEEVAHHLSNLVADEDYAPLS